MARIHLSIHVIRTYGLRGKCNNWSFPCIYSLRKMPRFCAIPGCSKHSNRDSQVNYHHLPLKNKLLLKQWIHKIGRMNLPLNDSTRICNNHFINSRGRMLHLDEVSSLKLPVLPTQATLSHLCRLLTRSPLPEPSDIELSISDVSYGDAAVNTDLTGVDVESLEGEVRELRNRVVQSERECADLKMRQLFDLDTSAMMIAK